MTIWITGGAGFLGRRLTSELKKSNVHVVSLSRRKSDLADESMEIDIANEPEALRALIKKHGPPEVLIHAAAKQPGSGSLHDFVKSNCIATENLVDSLIESPPDLIIFTSTLSVYAVTSSLPVSEKAPATASTPYAASKRWAEQLVETFGKSKRVVLRLPSLYGAGQVDSFVDGLAKTAMRNQPLQLFSRGELIRDALHVSDVIRAIQSCIHNPPAEKFCLMNLGTGRPITTLNYASALVQALGSTSAIELSDRQASQVDLYADIEAARRTIGFQPTELRESMSIYANELRA